MINLQTLLVDPERGLKMLIDDFQKRMKHRNVSNDAIKGMTIALQIAFRLGENSAIQKIIKDKDAT